MKIITVNGREYPLKDNDTLASLLKELDITPVHMAIEQNGRIVSGELLEQTAVIPGDIIEIIQFVGGG